MCIDMCMCVCTYACISSVCVSVHACVCACACMCLYMFSCSYYNSIIIKPRLILIHLYFPCMYSQCCFGNYAIHKYSVENLSYIVDSISFRTLFSMPTIHVCRGPSMPGPACGCRVGLPSFTWSFVCVLQASRQCCCRATVECSTYNQYQRCCHSSPYPQMSYDQVRTHVCTYSCPSTNL